MRRMSLLPETTTLLLCGALALAVTGCGKKKSPEAAGGEAAASSGGGAVTAQMPDTKEARTFADKLVATTVESWEPVSGGGDVNFTYNTMTFSPDGSWKAKATLEASFEKIPCVESGTWTIESADTTNAATMLWTIDSTSCPTRESGAEQRVEMELPKPGSYKINFR